MLFMKKINVKRIVAAMLSGLMLLQLTACNGFLREKINATDMTKDVTPQDVEEKYLDDAFLKNQVELSAQLFKQSVARSGEENVLVSPLSISLALAMTANGANGDTLAEMEGLLAGELSIAELNQYLNTYVNHLPSDEKYRFHIANSIWYRDDESLIIEKDFLQTNADYYGASIYKSPFDETTVTDINNWVKNNTDGMIEEIIDRIDYDTVMYLINALSFDAEWNTKYLDIDIWDGTFTTLDKEERSVKMMNSMESVYLENEDVTGFMKPYKDEKYSFVALLPKDEEGVDEFISGMTGETLQELFKGQKSASVEVVIPKFSYEYSISMNEMLKDLGMPTAFNTSFADFSKMGSSSLGNIYIGDVAHKTFITVDENGTKAGAVTKVEMKAESAVEFNYRVTLNRPFVYMIVDNENNLPIFMGMVMDTDITSVTSSGEVNE